VLELQAMPHAALDRRAVVFLGHVGREVRVDARRVAEIGRGPAGEQLAVGHVFRRKGHGHGENRASDARLSGERPERGAAALRAELFAEHAVLAGIGARGKRRPRRRAGRRRRLEPLERAPFRELLHVRQPARVHELAHQIRIEAVHAEDDELLVISWRALAGARRYTYRQSDEERASQVFHWQMLLGKDAIITSCVRWASTWERGGSG